MSERFDGWCYAADGPQRMAVQASVDASGQLSIAGTVQASWSALRISDRVGSIPRRLTLPDGRVLETADNDAVDRIEARLRGGGRAALLHRLERHWPVAFVALLLTLAVGWFAVARGVPLAARLVAFGLPPEIMTAASNQTLATLDRLALHPSKLPEARQAEIGDLLHRVETAAGSAAHYRLAMRDGGGLGANAFALPDGTIVVTDQLVKLAENDDQILAVLAHEAGHVERRHGMQRVTQSAAIGLLLTAVVGDVSQILTVASALPGMLIESSYSRDFEREADGYAIDLLSTLNIAPSNLARMLERLQEKQGRDPGPSWLSSHPSTPERARAIQDRAKPP